MSDAMFFENSTSSNCCQGGTCELRKAQTHMFGLLSLAMGVLKDPQGKEVGGYYLVPPGGGCRIVVMIKTPKKNHNEVPCACTQTFHAHGAYLH